MIRFGAVILGFLAVAVATSVNASLRGTLDQEESTRKGAFPKTETARSLMTNDFSPLACNKHFAPCINWTTKFGNKTEHTARLFVECGECVAMDHPGPVVTLNDGIDIRGKLQIIRNDTEPTLTIKSTMVSVQGELAISATKAVDGKPLIKFVLEGEDSKSFTPIQENSEACGGNQCIVGKKAITVAGGKVDIHGLPPDTSTWVHLYDISSDLSTLVVDASIYHKWEVGAEILVTSATRIWDDHQVRRIAEVTPQGQEQQHVSLKLDSPLSDRPTTMRDSSDFAVEVALLSRNIVFQGGYDSNLVHGAHFWVLQTPTVQQMIEGVEFVNFGQQGTLGRYPIHFHFCGDVPGSAVLRNVIRKSNQRCVVVHGTNKLRIEKNVAFDTKGHCFITEDGIETDNEFIHNLGAQTGKPAIRIPNMGSNGVETDIDIPSTFWITSASNKFIGNVVAGSEGAGWWFELLLRGAKASQYSHVDPKREPLGEFVDNVIHSCGDVGLRTYPSGYTPHQEAAFIGLKAYRNSKDVFFHRTSNVAVVGGIFADSKVAIDIDRAEDVRLDGSLIIGESESYRKLMESRRLDKFVCSAPHIGIELHTWKNDYDNEKVVIENIRFSGFSHIPCNDSFPISMDDTIKTKAFDLFTTIRNVTIEADAAYADFCRADSVGIVDIFLMDLDGSLAPEGFSVNAPSALVSDNPTMLTFIDQNKCTRQVGLCYSYCEGVCLRSVRYETSPAETENHKLKVCKKGSLNSCISLAGYQVDDDATDSTKNRIFLAHLPLGEYLAVFMDERGKEVWPSFVETKYEEPLCPNALSDGAVSLQVPEIDRNSVDPFQSCKHLVRNGNFEASEVEPRFWLARQGGITLDLFGGKETSRGATAEQKDALATIIQYVDSRCLEAFQGQFYKMQADIRLSREDSSVFTCNPVKTKCPEVGFFSEDFGFMKVASVASAGDKDGFQKAEGFVKITDEIVQASAIAVYVRSNVDGMLMTVDGVVVSKVEDASLYCKNLIQYSTFADLISLSVWGPSFQGKGVVTTASPGFNNSTRALLYRGRSDVSDGPSYKAFRNIDTDCLRPESSWRLVAQLKLFDTTSNLGGNCDPQKINNCPSAFITISDETNVMIFKGQWRSYPDAWSANNFNRLQADFTLPSAAAWDGSIGAVKLDFRNFPVQYDVIVGSVMLARTS